MTLPASFAEELHLVDPTRSFTEVIDPSYGENEWSINGWELRGGSQTAIQHAATEALYQMDFRFYTPFKKYLPASVPSGGVTLSKRAFILPYSQVFLNYGFGSDPVLDSSFDRWRILNSFDDRRKPNGHTWKTIINANSTFYDANPDHIIAYGKSGGGRTFSFETPEIIQANHDICVAYILANLNEYDRAAFDPDDGDPHPSDVVFGFANNVISEVRETVPNAKLGLYAYAGHRAPPSFNCPHLTVQVALGFNDLGLGYPELVRRWGLVCPEVDLRGYGDIAAQNGFLPKNSAICTKAFFTSVYPGYIEDGAVGLRMETTANWAKNIVSHYHMAQFIKWGTSTYDEVVEDMLPKIFGNDSAVRELFDYWGDPGSGFSDAAMARSFAIIDKMQDAPYRTEFRHYMTLCEGYLRMTPSRQRNGEFNDDWSDLEKGRYFSKLEKTLRHAESFAYTGELHSYALTRQLANSNVVSNDRGDLAFNANPHWKRYPEVPTDADYFKFRDDLYEMVSRPDALEFAGVEDLALVIVTPEGSAASLQTPATEYVTQNSITFYFHGPGMVTFTPESEGTDPTIRAFGAGIHTFKVKGIGVTTWTGGDLYLLAYPEARFDPVSGAGFTWCYIPKLVRGNVKLYSQSRLTIYDRVGRKDIGAEDNPNSVAFGLARIDPNNTRGIHQFGNINPFVSPRPDRMLMPKSLAKVEMSSFVLISHET